MDRRWVVNTSPLIVLAKISRTHLLEDLCEDLIIPSSVAHEIDQGPASDPARAWMQERGSTWTKIVAIDPIVAAWDLGSGETQVISYAAQNKSYEAILDDQAARKCASTLGIQVKGTLGVILLAKREGLVPNVRAICDQLIKAGLRIDPRLLREVLRLAGESDS